MPSRRLYRALLPVLAVITMRAQELQPRAYLPAPVGLTLATFGYSNNSGGLLFDPTVPVENSSVHASVASLGLGMALGLLGRSGQVLAVLPYVVADIAGNVAGTQQSQHRSGLADSTFRFAINIHGAPAMRAEEFARYRARTIIGASLTVTAPTGQYDPNFLINIGTNRWAFKPEFGISRIKHKWEFEGAFGAWLYTSNTAFYRGMVRTQDPLGSIQMHVVRVLPRKTWLAFDGTLYMGGRSFIGKSADSDYKGNTRFGGTFGMAIASRQALRFAFFRGATTRVGPDISSVSITYQLLWQARHNRRDNGPAFTLPCAGCGRKNLIL